MPPVSVRLKGFKGIRSGLGMEEVFIDFSGLPEGLIAVAGKNGAGKTTVLDNLHHYRLMPYKLRTSKNWSPDAFSYYDQCYGREAMKEYVSEENGIRYKSTILIDAERRKQEAYFFKEVDGEWVPYNEAVKDGKTGPYDEAIEEVFGSPSLYFTSRFRSQEARKLSSYPRSEILNIVSEMLNVDHIKEQGEKASSTALALEKLVADLEQRKTPILAALGGQADLEERKTGIDCQIELQERGIRDLKQSVSESEKKLHDLELSIASQVVSRQRVAEKNVQLDSMRSRLNGHKQDIAILESAYLKEQERIDNAIFRLRDELSRDASAFSVEERQEQERAGEQLVAIDESVRKNRVILSRSEEIRQALKRQGDLESRLPQDRQRLESVRSEQADLKARIAELVSTDSGLAGAIDQDHANLKHRTEALIADEKREKAAANGELKVIAGKKQSVETILARAEEIHQAVKKEGDLDALLTSESQRLDNLRAEYSALQIKEAELSHIGTQIETATARLKDLRKQAAGMKGLDCHENGSQTVNKGCKLLVSAVAAESQIPEVEAEIARLSARQKELDTIREQMVQTKERGTKLSAEVKRLEKELTELRRLSQMTSDLNSATARMEELAAQEINVSVRLERRLSDIARELENISKRSQERQAELGAQKCKVAHDLSAAREQSVQYEKGITTLSDQVTRLESELIGIRKVAQLAGDLDNATARIADLTARRDMVNAQLKQRLTDIARKLQEATVRSNEREKELHERKGEAIANHENDKQLIEQKIAALTLEIDTLSSEIRELEASLDGEAEKETSRLNDSIAMTRCEVSNQESTLRTLVAEMGNIQGQLEELSKQQHELVKLDAKIGKINEEITNWKILVQACSNDGIIALELDDAGPSISTDTNRLLACYGSRYSVRLETQGTTSKGGLKEVFDITVFDAERDEVKSIRDMSGGEETYIEDAVTRAFCLHNMNRSGATGDTLFSDEKDGALDAGRKLEYLDIKRETMNIGQHTREFFITQTPELSQMADARIMLAPGAVRIESR